MDWFNTSHSFWHFVNQMSRQFYITKRGKDRSSTSVVPSLEICHPFPLSKNHLTTNPACHWWIFSCGSVPVPNSETPTPQIQQRTTKNWIWKITWFSKRIPSGNFWHTSLGLQAIVRPFRSMSIHKNSHDLSHENMWVWVKIRYPKIMDG